MRGDKRELILRAAEQVLSGRRLHEVTLDEVARAARVSKGTIYTYFQDKDELFFQLATEGFEELCELLSSRSPANGPFEARLGEVCSQISTFFVSRRPLMRVMIEHEGRTGALRRGMRERWKQKRRLLVQAVEETLRSGVAEGRVRADVAVGGLAELLLGMLRARGRRSADDGEEIASIAEVVDVFLNGAGSAGGR